LKAPEKTLKPAPVRAVGKSENKGRFLELAMGPAVRWSLAVLFALTGACNRMKFVGSKFIKTQAVSASQGGVIIVGPTDDPNLAGLTIHIPVHALANDTTITIAEAAPLGASQLGTTAELGPNGTHFDIAATVTLPFAADGGSDVSVIGMEDNGTSFTVADSDLSIDAEAYLVSFPVTGFTSYAVVDRCGAGTSSATPVGSPAAWTPCSTPATAVAAASLAPRARAARAAAASAL
jgi:hypothetical protein